MSKEKLVKVLDEAIAECREKIKHSKRKCVKDIYQVQLMTYQQVEIFILCNDEESNNE